MEATYHTTPSQNMTSDFLYDLCGHNNVTQRVETNSKQITGCYANAD